MTVIVLPFHRVGYCNSTALIEAHGHVLKTLNYTPFPLPPCTFILSGCEEPAGASITQCYTLRNVWFSPYGIVFGRRQLFLARVKKRETCSYPRTAQHHATCHCPLATSSPAPSSSHIASSSPRSPASAWQSFVLLGFRVFILTIAHQSRDTR